MDGYRHRIMDSLLEKKLQAKGAVLIEGPKWCGNTTTAEEIASSKIMLARTDARNNFKNLRSKTAIRIADTRYFVDPSISIRFMPF